jgi:hypothetical protein
METLAFLLLVTMQSNNTGVMSVSMELFDYDYLVATRVLHSNDGLRPNTAQYTGEKWECNETIHQPFIDLKKAYDSMRKAVLYGISKRLE